MPYVTKAQWQQRLRDLGEEPPTAWTVVQLQNRYEELQTQTEDEDNQELEAQLRGLRAASRLKKGVFLDYLAQKGLPHNPNATVKSLFGEAEKAITMSHLPKGNEILGFGKHGNLSYTEVILNYPSYVTWAENTVLESDDAHWRLRRFVDYAKTLTTDKFGKKKDNRKASTGAPSWATSSGASSGRSFTIVESGSRNSEGVEQAVVMPTNVEELQKQLQAALQAKDEIEREKAEMERQLTRSKNRKEM